MYIQQNRSKPCPHCYNDKRDKQDCGVCLGSGRVFEAYHPGSAVGSVIRAIGLLFLFFAALWIASVIIKGHA